MQQQQCRALAFIDIVQPSSIFERHKVGLKGVQLPVDLEFFRRWIRKIEIGIESQDSSHRNGNAQQYLHYNLTLVIIMGGGDRPDRPVTADSRLTPWRR